MFLACLYLKVHIHEIDKLGGCKMRKNKHWISISIIFIFCLLGFLKNFNLSWVETYDNEAKITINFLFPMKQEGFKEYITLMSQRSDSRAFSYNLKWLNHHVVEINLQEHNDIKGQKIKLMINKAPTQFESFTKSETVMVQFKSDIEILSPTQDLLISSNQPFLIQFNTAVSLNQMYKYLQCDAKFYIKPYEEVDSEGKKHVDDTKFILLPKEPLENEKCYVLLLKSGMTSKSGTLLKKDQVMMLQVDKKPVILKTYPAEGDKWIGLYPRLTLESKESIIKAVASINGKLIEGVLTDTNHVYFLLDDLLKSDTTYSIDFQTQVESGELSLIKSISFSTTTLNENRFWIDIRTGSSQKIDCYEGDKLIRTIPCQVKKGKQMPLFGTYYLQDKAEVYENNQEKLGANYWMVISENFGIHGETRNAYWQPIDSQATHSNIIISDEEAAWLYEKMNTQNMIVLRE